MSDKPTGLEPSQRLENATDSERRPRDDVVRRTSTENKSRDNPKPLVVGQEPEGIHERHCVAAYVGEKGA